MTDNSERRKYMRFDVLFDGLCRTGEKIKKLRIQNFSREGIGIVSDNVLSPGDEAEIEMMIPGDEAEIEMMIPGDNVPVVVSGTVAWAENDTTDVSGYKGGMLFRGIGNPERSRILDHIYSEWLMPNK